MTDSSMNFGPAWIRNLRSEGTATTGGGTSGGSRYQLAEYRYGREEMLALFDKFVKPPSSLVTFKTLYSEQTLVPLALLPTSEEEQRGWQSRPTTISGAPRGRGGSLERGGRISRGRGGYQAYGRAASAYDSGWGNGEQPDWSPRKEFATRSALIDNWRRVRNSSEEDDGWRNISSNRSLHEKWGRSASWRGDGDSEERNGPPERGGRSNWHENNRGGPLRRSWDNEDHLPEWATENPTEGGGTFDERGAFHGSDDEQEHRSGTKRDMLQKSTSQQHIPSRSNQPPLSSSKSTTSLTKSDDSDRYKEEPSDSEGREDVKSKESSPPEIDKSKVSVPQKIDKRTEDKEERKPEELIKLKPSEKSSSSNGPPQDTITPHIDKVDEDFDRLQEDLVFKLVVDEETPKATQTSTNFDVAGVQQPPPNLVPPSQEKWYYQDPQGTRQGPFPNVEMAEWYKAGYFSNQLNVMRECDERYFLLGELISLCGGENPFLSNIRFPVLKNDAPKLPDDMLPYQFLSQSAFKQQVSLRNLAEPWSALTLQQQELAAQRLLLQQQQQLPHELQFMQQSTPSNPLMYMINQMQQNNKLPGSVLVDKPSSSVPNQLDPLLVQMGNMHSLQNRMQTPGLHNHLPSGVPTNLSSSLPPDGLGSSLPGLQTPPMPSGGISSLPSIHASLPSGLPGSVNVNRPTSHGSIDQLPPNQDNDPITNFLKQFQQQRQLPLDSLWQKQNQFNVPPPVSTPTQWPQQPETTTMSMWDLQTPTSIQSEVQLVPPEKPSQQEKEKELRPKEEAPQKETKKRKEQEEKQAKKEADERRKQEQKKQEADKKAAEEKRKKEEEKIRKELDKAKKEAEEKRLRELEEKRRLKEQRKAEEEAKKKSEELKKQEDEKLRREKSKEREEKKQAEASRLSQNQANRAASKTAPWIQSNFMQGVNLTDIQKAEKEKRAQDAALQQQKQQLQEQHQQQQQLEKPGGIQLSWAKKPVEPRKVKSFAEIQAEEQERLAKLTAEARLAAQLKEKEAPVPANSSGNIWNGQSLTWANASSTSQWSSNSAGGFWDEVPTKSSNKPSTVSKSNSTSAMTTTKPQQKQSKSKPKKEESPKTVNNNNNQSKDEFTDWCYKTLSNISADVDIPTFVTFLRDIESAYDVRDYCKEYLGESPATQQFASNFLEKRRSFKPKNNAHKDDMCSPAPAITPSMQHNTEFQEVKGKNKKNKKSKMLKVDARILGFNVTSAPDRINVGDRDYGDNS